MEPIIEFKDITKDYDKNVVIPNLNLSINKGEFITIIGTSGSGKTTVLKMMNGLIEPTSGMIQIHGKDTAIAGAEDQQRAVTEKQKAQIEQARDAQAEHALHREADKGGEDTPAAPPAQRIEQHGKHQREQQR